MDLKAKIQRLKIYIEKCDRDYKKADSKHIKAFFDREIKRTQAALAKIQE